MQPGYNNTSGFLKNSQAKNGESDFRNKPVALTLSAVQHFPGWRIMNTSSFIIVNASSSSTSVPSFSTTTLRSVQLAASKFNLRLAEEHWIIKYFKNKSHLKTENFWYKLFMVKSS